MKWLQSLTVAVFAVLLTAWTHGSAPTGSMSWTQVAIGAGGQVTNVVFASDGTGVAKTDAYGGYVRPVGSTIWTQLFTSTLQGDLPSSPGGVWDITATTAASSRIYLATQGFVYSSTSGSPWHQTNFPRTTAYNTGGGHSPSTDPNGDYKYANQKLVVDPANLNVVYFATENNGIQRSFDSGVTTAQIAAITASTSGPGGAGIVFDPTSGTASCPSGGGLCTKTIFVGSFGQGVWRSLDAGSTWTQIADGSASASPTQVWEAQIAPDGAYWAQDHANVWKCASGCTTGAGWTKITNANTSLGGTNYINSVVPNPNVSGAVVFFQNMSAFRETITNNGTFIIGTAFGNCDAWTYTGTLCNSGSPQTSTGAITNPAGDIPWLQGGTGANASLGGVSFDPISGKYCGGNGVGIFCVTVPTATSVCFVTFTCLPPEVLASQSVKVEELVTRDLVSIPGQSPILISEDRPTFQIANINTYPSAYGPSAFLAQGMSGDYASSDTTFVCVRAYDSIDVIPQSACSPNSGLAGTWTVFSGAIPSDNLGGAIAVADHNNIVINTGQSNQLACTTNGGAAWALCSGVPTTTWGGAFFGIFQNICADRVNVGTFYGYHFTDASHAQLYSTTSLGIAFSAAYTGVPIGGATAGGSTRLRCVPGNAGHLFLAADMGEFNPGHFFLAQSTNGGVSWTNISKANGYANDVTSLVDFGLGAIAPTKSYPRIWISGYVDGVFGFWYSDDQGHSWTKPTNNSPNTIDFIYGVNADMNNPNMVWMMTGGSGLWSGKLN